MAFNQTKMELKRGWLCFAIFRYSTFNQTKMELKHRKRNYINFNSWSFNQTKMELKRALQHGKMKTVFVF